MSASASSNEFAAGNRNNGSSRDVPSSKPNYLESFSSAWNQEDAEQLQVEERLQRLQRRLGESFTVTLPIRHTGLTVVQVLEGRQLLPGVLDLDRIDQIQTMDDSLRQSLESTILPQLDASFRGLVIASVQPDSMAAQRPLVAGTILQAVSATLGDAVWPKSTLEGVQAALRSRQLTASEVTLSCANPSATTTASVDRYELMLTKPIGMLLQEQDGQVVVTGLTEQASTLVQYAVQMGDRVVAVDSTFGGQLWPVSTLEGVVSACTSRLPGQSIRMVLERPRGTTMASTSTLDQSMQAVETESVAVAEAGTATPTVDHTKLLSQCREVIRRYSATKGSKMDKYNLPAMVADKVVDALASASASVDPVTLSMIMTAYLTCEQPKSAMKAFEAATGFAADGSSSPLVDVVQGRDNKLIVPSESSLNLYTATALLRAHAQNRDLASISRVLLALEGQSGVNVDGLESAPWPWTGPYGTIQPDTTCFNTAIAAAEKVGGPAALDFALNIFERMGKNKDIITYNTLISMLTNAGQTDEAFRQFESMKEAGLSPDKYTYTSLLKASFLDSDITEILYEMEERGVSADVMTYNTALKRLCDQRKFTKATRLVSEMEARGVKPDSRTYGLLMSAMLKAGKANACLTLFESASSNPRTAALTENIHLYTTAIAAAGALGAHERALEFVTRMNASGVAPNVKTLTAVVGACLTSNQPELAAQLYRRIRDPDGYAMTLGINALCAAGEYEEAAEMLRAQGKQSKMSGKQLMQSYRTTLESSLRSNNYETARSVLMDFLQKGFILNKNTIVAIADVMMSEDHVSNDKKFSFCLFAIDSIRGRNLAIDSRLYEVTLTLGHRLGGLYRKLASLLAQSKTAAAIKSQRFLSATVESLDDRIKVARFEDLLAEPELLDGQIALPPLPVHVPTSAIRSVTNAERLVWSRTKRKRVLI